MGCCRSVPAAEEVPDDVRQAIGSWKPALGNQIPNPWVTAA